MSERIDIASLLEYLEERPLIDVRTPAEFAKGHIPGAYNLPLFTNEERVVVGTAYKQESPQTALLEGLDFVGPKMRSFVEKALSVAPDKTLMVHCWRGGRRSESMGWLLDLAGFEVGTVRGGYKAYRSFILRAFAESKLNLIVLGGYTGSGKTEVLKALAERGEQVIDLERLAQHKGSSFGALGEKGQPSVEQFENDLFEIVRKLDPDRRIWLEDESQSIGRVYIPLGFWQQMRQAPLLVLEVPLQERVKYLVHSYAQYPPDKLMDAFTRIKKRLGGQSVKSATVALQAHDYETAAAIGLKYYDKAYRFGLEKRPRERRLHLNISSIQPNEMAQKLLSAVRENAMI